MTVSSAVPRVITRFSGQWNYLSNFYQTPIILDGLTYPSAEHAFQAAKTNDPDAKRGIAEAHSSAQAKALGRSVPLVDGWNEWRRYEAMERVVAAKFAPGTELASWLSATGGVMLVEGNSWHDNTWGACDCGKCPPGHNLLGWMLMRQRGFLQGDLEDR